MTREIPLSQGKFATVDDADYDMLSRFTWHFTKGYAARHVRTNGKDSKVYMHRAIMNPSVGTEVDHRDGDGINNTRANLRQCTHAQNMKNLRRGRTANAPYKGVSWNKQHGKFVACIGSGVGGYAKHIGVFADPISAARAYDAAARELHGEFASLNFPDGSIQK